MILPRYQKTYICSDGVGALGPALDPACCLPETDSSVAGVTGIRFFSGFPCCANATVVSQRNANRRIRNVSGH